MYINGKNITFLERGIRSIDTINTELRKCEPLTNEQEYDLWLGIRQGNKHAFNRLVESNMPYAMRIARQYLPSKAALEDLYQAGCEGLVRAAHKFDASLGFRFISFATWFVENEVRKAAYNYIRHDVTSLDEPLDAEDERGSTHMDNVVSYPSESADWNLRYRDALNSLKSKMEERQYGLGRLVGELHQMLLDGYSTTDFARRYRLNESQMNRFLTVLREEARLPLRSAA